MTKVSIDSKLSGWNSGFELDPNTTYHIRPSAATKYTINGGATQVDFHGDGDGDMDGSELGIPAKVRVGGLTVLVWHNQSGSSPVPQIITFPPGKDSDSVTIGSNGGSMHFMITDKRATFGDNSGSCEVDITPSSVPKPVFPIKGSRYDDVAGRHMQTDFSLDAGGTFNAVTRWWTNVKLTGFTGSVTVVLTDSDKRPLWATASRTHGVDGEFVGDDDRHENWSETVPSDIVGQVHGYAILQQHDPKWLSLVGDRGEQFLRWLNSDEGKATIATIAVML